MAQVKKEAVRQSILKGAKRLFSKHGYAKTSMNAIAESAGVSTSNTYNYFDSKLDVLFGIYAPWLTDHLRNLESEISGIESPKERVRAILIYLWVTIPADDDGFANNLNQALSVATRKEHYSRQLLALSEGRTSRLLAPCLKPEYEKFLSDDILSHLIFMAFDGFVMNYMLPNIAGVAGCPDRPEQVADMLATILARD